MCDEYCARISEKVKSEVRAIDDQHIIHQPLQIFMSFVLSLQRYQLNVLLNVLIVLYFILF